ncbi:MAG TPA: cytochrome c [Candidatus Acidoferrales bacterium]|nr:cytochrome c [Candidatus Acidoferrales bacterium]
MLMIFALLGTIAEVYAAQKEQDKNVPVPRSNSLSGVELFRQHCAVCHGNDLKGVRPVPPPYRVPPDLTTLARRHGGVFPVAYVTAVLRNGVTMPAHGPAQMPAWGTDFREMEGMDPTQVKIRISALTNFIKSRQTR